MKPNVPSASEIAVRSPKREHLIDTALELFARHGFQAVGIDTVIARAGVAKMTLYHHFRSKEELIAAALERQAHAIAGKLGGFVAAAGDQPQARILAVFDWLEAWFRSPDYQGCLFIKAACEYPENGDIPRIVAVAFKQETERILRELCAELPGVNSAALARQLALLVDGATVLSFIYRSPAPADDARAAARALLAGATKP